MATNSTYTGVGKNGGSVLRLNLTTQHNSDIFIPDLPGIGLGVPMERVRVPEVYIPLGSKPGHAVIEISYKSTGRANQIALDSSGSAEGTWEKIKHGQRVTIGRSSGSGTQSTFWTGRVAIPNSNIDQDTITLTALDDRWSVQDVCVVGRWVVDPTLEAKSIYWQQGWPAIFNPGGRPNCMICLEEDEGIPVPVFSPSPDYGLDAGEHPPDQPTTDKAAYWTPGLIFRYLRYFLGRPESASLYTGSDSIHPIKTFPDDVVWPVELAQHLDDNFEAEFDEGRGQGKGNTAGSARKGAELSADCASILDFMESMLETAGWTLSIVPGYSSNSSGKLQSLLTFVRNYCAESKGETLYVVRGDSDKKALPNRWTGGQYREDSTDVATRNLALGSLVKVERRIDSTEASASLSAAWSDAHLTAFKARGTAISASSPDDMELLFSEHPLVCAAFKINMDFAFTSDTSEEAYSSARLARPIMPYLLSWMGGEISDYVAQRHPIRIERSDDGTSWELCKELTGLEVWDDGTIWVPALRQFSMGSDAGSYWWDGDEYDFTKFEVSKLRMTVAIPCDHRLHALSTIAEDEVEGRTGYIKSPDGRRLHKDFLDTGRQQVLDLRGRYNLWERIDSWPYPATISGQTKADDHKTREDPLRDDSPFLQTHGRMRLQLDGRAKRGGQFTKPGIFAPVTLGAPITRIVSEKDGGQTSEVEVSCIRSAMLYATDKNDHITTTQFVS